MEISHFKARGFVRDFSAGVDWFRGRAGTAGVLLAVLGWVSVLVNVNQPKIKKKEHLAVRNAGDSRARGVLGKPARPEKGRWPTCSGGMYK